MEKSKRVCGFRQSALLAELTVFAPFSQREIRRSGF
jgi:hypothetical protein